MESEPKKADVEDRLRETAEAITERLSSLQEEVSSTGLSVRDWVSENPLKSVGGMFAAGITVGLLFGGSGSRRRPEHSELLDQYIDALRTEIEEAVASGAEPSQALEAALRDRVPLIVYREDDTDDDGSRRSLVSRGIGLVVRTIVREVARDALVSMLSGAEEGGAEGEGTVE